MVKKFHALAGKLPFDDVSEIWEQDPPDGKPAFTLTTTHCDRAEIRQS